jgi:DNA repair photolyase
MQTVIPFKVEKRRVLVPVGAPCPFGCRYCYTRGGEVGKGRIEMATVLSQLRRFIAVNDVPFETIQFGYDGDPFAFPERGIAMLSELATLGKHVNFSTKAYLTCATLDALSEISDQMARQGAILSALVSLSCWDSAGRVEPHTPSPEDRLATVAGLAQRRIPVFIAVRPILPHIADREYEQIACEGKMAGCDGFILGPLYADDRGQFVRFLPAESLAALPYRRCTVPWSAHAPSWLRYEDEARLHRLTLLIQEQGGHVFHSSADAVQVASQERRFLYDRS